MKFALLLLLLLVAGVVEEVVVVVVVEVTGVVVAEEEVEEMEEEESFIGFGNISFVISSGGAEGSGLSITSRTPVCIFNTSTRKEMQTERRRE